jgi:pimeloyl-ACP methyl ester carboxylesterase
MMIIRERSIDIAERRFAFLEAGAGWPVILLHAFPLNAEMWRPQLERVPEGCRFIAPDFRGFGRSLVPPKRSLGPREGGRITIDDYAADVLSLMDGLELDAAVIGGLSMGGYTAFAMHRLAPSRFTGLVLADTRPQADTPQALAGRVRLREVLAKDGPAGVAGEMLPNLLGETTRAERPDLVRQTRALIESASPEAIDAGIGALMGRPDSTPGLDAISCSTLVLVGDEDTITPPDVAEAMQRAIKRSTLAVIPGAGHLSCLEQPDVFSRGLRDFLLARL